MSSYDGQFFKLRWADYLGPEQLRWILLFQFALFSELRDAQVIRNRVFNILLTEPFGL